jgi:hypothetical protein
MFAVPATSDTLEIKLDLCIGLLSHGIKLEDVALILGRHPSPVYTDKDVLTRHTSGTMLAKKIRDEVSFPGAPLSGFYVGTSMIELGHSPSSSDEE